MYFFKDTNGNWVLGPEPTSFTSKAPCTLRRNTPTVVTVRTIEKRVLLIDRTDVTEIKKNAEGDFYANYAEFVEGVSGFFGNAPLDGAVINLEPGQYLSDVVQTITGATLENPVTINFYNHSKTVNWETFTEKIHWPLHVYLNFVGKINLWPNTYFPQMGFDEGLLSSNPTDKLFLGFSFDRTNDDSVIKVSGLPENIQKVFFGGLDQSYQIAESYQDLIDAPEDWGEAEFGLVRVNGSKGDDVRNDALYKKIDGVFIDVTPGFRYVDFSGYDLRFAYFYSANNHGASFYSANNHGASFYSANNQGAQFDSANNQGANFNSANNQGAYFISANNQGANFNSANNQGANFNSTNNQGAQFDSANLKDIDWSNVVSIENANFQNADLTGGVYLPERINTKAKWIAECGAGNVNAETIWIDGTSILS